MVKNENIATVWATSAHLMPLLMGLAGLSNTPMHWKNRAMAIPEEWVERARWAQTDGPTHHRILSRREIQRKVSSPGGTAKMGPVGRLDYRTRAFPKGQTWPARLTGEEVSSVGGGKIKRSTRKPTAALMAFGDFRDTLAA